MEEQKLSSEEGHAGSGGGGWGGLGGEGLLVEHLPSVNGTLGSTPSAT